MFYQSTRGAKFSATSAQAIKTGLCPDGGLFMPDSVPTLTKEEILSLAGKTYPQRAAYILGKFLTDYTEEELLADAEAAYSEEKFGAFPAPVTKLSGNDYLIELYHGPTCAFKDMALQMMPRLFTRALKKTGESRTAMILVATSGDTGKAALEGYRDVAGTKIQVFYPADGVSRVQKLQMQTQKGENVSVYGIHGNFDDAQNGVKRIFADEALKAELDASGVFLSSANSINWGRLVPQIVYYVSSYCELLKAGDAAFGETVDIAVPTGNFGNIFAAFLAKKMGLPFGKLICASNENNVLTDFLQTGTYNRNRPFRTTMSPSMDILISSNLERLLYTVADAEETKKYMKELSENGKYTVADFVKAAIDEHFIGYFTDESKTAETIRTHFERDGKLIDPHTAVAVAAAEAYRNEKKSSRKILIASTASPFKFAGDVYRSLCGKEAEELSAPDMLSALTKEAIPAPIAALKTASVRHSSYIDRADMDREVKAFAKA